MDRSLFCLSANLCKNKASFSSVIIEGVCLHARSAAKLSTQSCEVAMHAVLTSHKTLPRAKSKSWTSLIQYLQQEIFFSPLLSLCLIHQWTRKAMHLQHCYFSSISRSFNNKSKEQCMETSIFAQGFLAFQ